MKKLPLFLIGMLCFTALVTYINACDDKANKKDGKANKVQFSEYLQGTVSQRTPTGYGRWMAIKDEIVMGTGTGNLIGSPITFTLSINRRSKTDDQKSFIIGTWTFVSSSSDQISGILIGKGTTSDEFWGKFMTNSFVKKTGIYAHKTIRGDFVCKFAPLPAYGYGASLGYEAWWNGTILPRGE